MKKTVLVLLALVLISSLALPQRARINVEHVTPHSLTSLGLTTNSVSAGLRVIPNQTYAYFSAQNMASLTDPVTNAVFELVSKPSGSTATLQTLTSPNWTLLKPDVKGEYQVKLTITTALGTDDTTQSFYAADYVGVGNFDGVAGSFPKCMTCHSGTPAFAAIFDRWKVSGHANIFKTEITTGAAYYGTSCMKCHTTGYDHNIAASNGGFDDVAATLGWVWQGPPNAGKWDTLKTQFPGLVNLATIGCENCHGAGSEHATTGGNKARIEITYEAGNCAQCHDEPWRHNIYSMYENSLHSEALWETAFATRTMTTTDLNSCMRCHSGKGFIAFTKGQTISTPVSPTWAEHTPITCATCHDPHGNTNHASLRKEPASSDTLATGFDYSAIGGYGQLCMNCHKARRNNTTYVSTNVSSTWGPHYNAETDVLLGKNAYSFGSVYASTSHSSAISNTCVDCHMVATPDTGNVNRDKVGGHAWKLHNPETGYDHTAACTSCHGLKTSFDDFVAFMDYDGDGLIESIQNEVKGLLTNIAMKIPPLNVDSISWTGIRASSDSVLLKKAWWNYQLIQKGSAYGMHNAKYAIDVLSKTYAALGGVIPVELLSFTAEMNNGLVTLNWETATETNNRGFEIQRKTGNYDWQTIGFVSGKGTTTQMSNYSYNDNPVGINNYAKIVYRLKQMDYDGKVNYSKEINVEFTGAPKTFALEQNYPNPFNPSTTIRFAVPSDSKVKVVVYNLTGEVVKELVNEVKSAGYHETTFNTNLGLSLSSGIYFYSIEANPLNGSNPFRQTKKMILVK